MLSFEEQAKVLGVILQRETNRLCADCGSHSPTCTSELTKGPVWISECSSVRTAREHTGHSDQPSRASSLPSWTSGTPCGWRTCRSATGKWTAFGRPMRRPPVSGTSLVTQEAQNGSFSRRSQPLCCWEIREKEIRHRQKQSRPTYCLQKRSASGNAIEGVGEVGTVETQLRQFRVSQSAAQNRFEQKVIVKCHCEAQQFRFAQRRRFRSAERTQNAKAERYAFPCDSAIEQRSAQCERRRRIHWFRLSDRRQNPKPKCSAAECSQCAAEGSVADEFRRTSQRQRTAAVERSDERDESVGSAKCPSTATAVLAVRRSPTAMASAAMGSAVPSERATVLCKRTAAIFKSVHPQSVHWLCSTQSAPRCSQPAAQ